MNLSGTLTDRPEGIVSICVNHNHFHGFTLDRRAEGRRSFEVWPGSLSLLKWLDCRGGDQTKITHK